MHWTALNRICSTKSKVAAKFHAKTNNRGQSNNLFRLPIRLKIYRDAYKPTTYIIYNNRILIMISWFKLPESGVILRKLYSIQSNLINRQS